MRLLFNALIASVLLLSACSEKPYLLIEGQTMGTTYHIKYQDKESTNYSNEIDSILIELNQSLSTYIPSSTISVFNRSDSFAETDSFFREVFLAAKTIFQKTYGAFDPTVMPLVNAWGFGFEKLTKVDSAVIDSLLAYVGFDHVGLVGNKVVKDKKGIMLDFSAIAKGYGVDVLARFLDQMRVENYMVEIGGEVRVKGLNPHHEKWQVGIEKPEEGKRELGAVIEISNRSIATSGNYRNFYYKDGKRFAHTIDPATGYPVQHNVLSASVLAPDCMTADAFATACMVIGLEKAIGLDKKNEEIQVYLIFENNDKNLDNYCSPDLQNAIRNSVN